MGWYFIITEEMREMGLRGNDLLVYAIIAGFSRDRAGCFYGSRSYLAELAGCSTNTVDRTLAALCEQGFIEKGKGLNDEKEVVVTYTATPTPKMGDTPKMGNPHPQNGDTPTPKMGNNNKSDNKSDNKYSLSNKGATAFSKPSVEEVREYCLQRMNTVSPEAFVAFYESNGWKVGRNPMKDWRAAVRTWEQRYYQDPSPRSARPLPKPESNYVTKGMAILEKIQRGEPLL